MSAKSFLLVNLVFILTTPCQGFCACDPREQSNCCVKDLDCVSIVYKHGCAVIASNRTEAAKLEQDKRPAEASCSEAKTAELQQQAKESMVQCVEQTCRLLSERF